MTFTGKIKLDTISDLDQHIVENICTHHYAFSTKGGTWPFFGHVRFISSNVKREGCDSSAVILPSKNDCFRWGTGLYCYICKYYKFLADILKGDYIYIVLV